MAENFTFAKYTIVPVPGLNRKEFFQGIDYTNGLEEKARLASKEILRRFQSVAPDYFSDEVIEPLNQGISPINNTGYKFLLSKGQVRAQAVFYDNLGKISEEKSGVALCQKISTDFQNTSGFLINAEYLWREQKQGLQLMCTTPQYLGGMKWNDQTKAFGALLNVLVGQNGIDSSTLFGNDRTLLPFDYCDGISEVSAYLSNPSVERVHQADDHVGEFMQWMQSNRKEIDTMGVYVRLAASEFELLEKLQKRVPLGQYLPESVLVVQGSIERHLDEVRAIYSRLTPPQNKRMDYLCFN